MLKHFPSLIVLAVFCLMTRPSQASVIISEFMAQNLTSNVVDEDAERSDWLELHNRGATTVSLNGWYLTDNASNKQKWRFPVSTPAVTLAPGEYLVIWCSDKNRKANKTKLHTNFKLDAGGEYLALIQSDGLTVEYEFAPKYPPQIVNGTYGTADALITTAVLPEGAPGKAKVAASAADFSANFIGWNSSTTFDDSSWQAGPSGFGFGTPFEGLIGTDISAQMQGINASCFVRFIFNIPPGTNPVAARLKTKFDDGYVAYLNGTKIADFYAPGTTTWNSATLVNLDRSDASASTFDNPTYRVPPLPLLVSGDNVLAFQMLNSTATNSNVVLRPQFEIDTISGSTITYLTSPTPGAANSLPTTAIGPSISQVTDRPPQPAGGAGSAPLTISAKVTPTLNPLAASNPVVLKYRIAYNAESSLVMLDNGGGSGGSSGDLIAGDGIYTCKIPTTTMTAGQMIRWRIEAKDSGSPATYGYAPPYPFSPTTPPGSSPPVDMNVDLDQYYGTVALDGITTSQLPILHWFTSNESGADGTGGASSSFFFAPIPKFPAGTPGYTPPAGRFYDNIPTNRHGQSSGGFPKKSNNVGFNKDNRFEWKDGEPAIRSFNLLTNYADKSKVRNPTVWWAWEKSGHTASHFDATVRVQRNGTFHGIYDIVEDGNEDFLQRAGLDKHGALYKVYNSLENANVAVNNGGGSEKKNPDDGDYSDLGVFVNGIRDSLPYTSRLQYVYDNVDVPSLVNFMAVHAIVMNRDVGHKNYYMYRDTHGTGDWAPLPWDQDLSLGHTWNSPGGAYFDDDIHSQGPLQVGTGNRLMQIVFNTPELNSIFVRRIRTLSEMLYVSATETNGPMRQKITALLDQLDPTPGNEATGTDDADLEMRRWGFWVDGSGTQIAYTDPRMPDHTMRTQAARITHSNPIPPNPGQNPYSNWGDGSTSIPPFIPGRRDFLFGTPAPQSGSYPVPATQPANPTLIIEQVTANPLNGIPAVLPQGFDNQDFEYFVIRNPNAYAVDISGWTLSGEVKMTFRGGTVIPAAGTATTQGTNAAYVNQLIVANNPAGIRQRTVSPKSGEWRYVTGPYKGQLSARGGPIVLSRPNNLMDPDAGYTQVASLTYPAAPTAPQQYLRITELNYHPADPTPAEQSALTGVTASEFEFIEITNTGPSSMNLSGARFDRGVEFTFPAAAVSTIAPGERRLIVSNAAAFRVRYGTSFDPIILGEYGGNLDNGGEELQLLDPAGEVVLEFTYDDAWYPPTDGHGRSLVTRMDDTSHTLFGQPTAWAIGGTANGTPGTADTSFAQVYEGWRWDHFTGAELETPSTIGNLTQDPDGDQLNNYEEYLFGRNPRTGDHPGALAKAGVINVAGINHLTITFTRVKNALDVTWNVEAGGTLPNFPDTAIFVSATDLGGGLESVTYRDPAPLSTGGRQMRVRALKP